MALPCLNPKQSDFRGYPFLNYTTTKTQSFQRNNCGSGQVGSWVSYSKTYTSNISEEDLQNIINSDSSNFNAQGQANANSNGTCSASCQVPTDSFNSSSPKIVGHVTASDVYFKKSNTSPLVGPYIKSQLDSGTSSYGSQQFIHAIGPFDTSWPNNGGIIPYVIEDNGGSNYEIRTVFTTNKCAAGDLFGVVPKGEIPLSQWANINFSPLKVKYIGLGNPSDGTYYCRVFKKKVEMWYCPAYSSSPIKLGEHESSANWYYIPYVYVASWYEENGGVAIAMTSDNRVCFALMQVLYHQTDIGFGYRRNTNRQLGIFEVTTNFFGEPTGVTQTYGWSRSNQKPVLRAFEGIGNDFFLNILYLRDSNSQTTISWPGSISNPPSSLSSLIYDGSRYAYGSGGRLGDPNNKVYRYDNNTNSWITLI